MNGAVDSLESDAFGRLMEQVRAKLSAKVRERTDDAASNANKLISYESKLAGILLVAYEHGPKDKPFDEEKAHRLVDYTALFILLGSKASKSIVKPKVRGKAAGHFGVALRAAHGGMASMPDLLSDIRAAWFDNATKDYGAAARDLKVGFDQIDRDFEKAIEGLSMLEAASRLVVQKHRQPRGRPSGSGLVTTGNIVWLAHGFREVTGTRATTAKEGWFAKLVRECHSAMGQAIGDDGAVKAIKAARKNNPSAFKN